MTSAADLFSTVDRVAVITGGATGLGFWMASAWVRNGGKVYIVGRREEKLKEAVAKLNIIAERAFYVRADVTLKPDIADLVSHISARESKLDVLVNNAGIAYVDSFPPTTETSPPALAKYDPAGWTKAFLTNTWAPGAVTAAFLPLLEAAAKDGGAKEGRGAVILISSIAGEMYNNSDIASAYVVSKAALNAFSKRLAAHLIPRGIRVNTIAPGTFPSEMNDISKPQMPGHPDQIAKYVPMARNGGEEDIAGVFLWLATRAGAYVTGQKVAVDGGWGLTMNGPSGS